MEANEILSLIGFEPTEGEEPTIDQIREYHNGNFAQISDIANRRDVIDPIVSKAIGQRLGSLQTKFVSSAKELGIEINHADFKDKPIEDLLPAIFGGIGEKLKAPKKTESELQKNYERLQLEYNELKNEVPKFQSQIEEITANFQKEKTDWLKNHAEDEAWKKLTFAPTANELMKRGFEAQIKSTYESMVDEQGNIYPVYKTGDKKGSRVANPAKITEHLKWEDLLMAEAKKVDLLPEAHAGKPTRPTSQPTRTAAPVTPQTGVRKVHPRFAEQANR